MPTMAPASSSPPPLLNTVFFFILFSCIITPSAMATDRRRGFTVELFHGVSPPSHTYNTTSTSTPELMMKGKSGSSCFGSFRDKCKEIFGKGKRNFTSKVAYNNERGFYTMKLAVGTPPVDLVAVVDTRSDFIWTQCRPCRNCYKQNLPIFHCRRSKTFKILSSKSELCKALDEEHRYDDGSTLCKYSYPYGDAFKTTGVVSSETFSFDSISSRRRKIKIPNVGFGCGDDNRGKFVNDVGGMIGLGRGPLSLVSQLGSSIGNKFSHCFVSGYDHHRKSTRKSTRKLKFGDHATFSGSEKLKTTPLLRVAEQPDRTRFYYLNLQDISVNDKRLRIPTESVKPKKDGGFIMDSAANYTYLAPNIYSVLESALKDAIVGVQQREGHGELPLCYHLDQRGVKDRIAWPSVTFHFEGDADWLVPPEYAFAFVDDAKFCSAFAPATSGFSLFGNIAQRNVHVEYDLEREELSFARTDCSTQ